jgi:hypothetical protein
MNKSIGKGENIPKQEQPADENYDEREYSININKPIDVKIQKTERNWGSPF